MPTAIHIETKRDRNPERTILDILKANAGRSILIRVYRKGRVRRRGHILENPQTQYTFFQEAYDVPASNREINKLFKGDKNEGWVYHWMTGSYDGGYHLEVGDELRVFEATHVVPRRQSQRFRSGVSHCVFTPMRAWAQELYDKYAAQAEEHAGKIPAKVRKGKCIYWNYLRILEKYEEQYHDGVPVEAFQPLVDELGKYFNTHITVELPLQMGALVDVRSKEARGKKFNLTNVQTNRQMRAYNFINTKLNHVELNEVTDESTVTQVTRDELNAMVVEMDANGDFYLFQQSPHSGITRVSTINGAFGLQSDYWDAVREFETESGLYSLKLDAVRHPELSEFVLRGMHYNITAVVPCGELHPTICAWRDAKNDLTQYKTKGLLRNAPCDEAAITQAKEQMQLVAAKMESEYMCIDIRKSYASFAKCRYYAGFPFKFTDLRPTDKMHGEGFYLIDQLDFSNADPIFLLAVENVMGRPYRNMNVYPAPELRCLSDMGVKYAIREGCWSDTTETWSSGCRNEAGMHIVFPGEPKSDDVEATGFYRKDLDRNGKGVPYYSKYVGACNSVSKYKTFWMKGTKEYFDNFATHLPEDARVRYYDNGAGQIEIVKRSAPHLSQITAYINGYERLLLLDQLMEIIRVRDGSTVDIAWVDKDDVTVRRGKSFTILPYMVEKPVGEKTYDRTPNACYVSNLWQFDSTECPYAPLTTPRPERQGGMIACLGPGGTGKTHINLVDKGLVGGVLYVAPSYDLLEAKMTEYGVDGRVRDVVLGNNIEIIPIIRERYATLLFDEISEWSMEMLECALEMYPGMKIILIGDVGYQLPPIKCTTPLTIAGLQSFSSDDGGTIEIYHYNTSFRCKCNRLGVVLTDLRAMIDKKCTERQMREYVLSVMKPLGQVVSFEDCVERFTMEDGIICSRNEFEQEYTEAILTRHMGEDLGNVAGLGNGFYENGCLLHRYRALTGASVPNGRILYATEEPFSQCVERYASTIHAYQGKTCVTNLFIDIRHMFELQHYYTAFSRAEYLHKIYIVDVPQLPPAEEFAKTLIYRIVSPHTTDVYVGHTTKTLTKRMEGHMREFGDKGRKKRCSSFGVIKCGDAKIELIEEWPCANKFGAKAREAHWIQRTPNCINKNLPGGKRKREDM